MQELSEIQTMILAFLPRLGFAILIFGISLWLGRVVRSIIHRTIVTRTPAPGALRLIEDVANGGIVTLGAVMAIQQFFDVTAFLAGLGIVGFTVGFALQDVMKNFAAGVILLVQQPFRVGDVISVLDFDGTVKAIDLRSTELMTLDGRVVILPNADVLNHAIVNYTLSKRRRIEVVVGVAYDSDPAQVRAVALDAIRTIPGAQTDPAPMALLELFNASSIDVKVLFWVETEQISPLAAKDAAIAQIHAAFAEHKIEIPFPIQTVVMEK
jgi:small conductance mechanosensitive channel